MKKRYLHTIVLSIFLFVSNSTYSQTEYDKEIDSIYNSFEKCLANFFAKQYKKIDTNYVFMYGNRFNPYMHLVSIDLGSGRYYTNTYTDALDSTHLSDTTQKRFFYRGMSFGEFINYVLEQNALKRPTLRKNKGVYVFVDCSTENWQHFYFDKLLYNDDFYLTPTVEVLEYKDDRIIHYRNVIVCRFRKKKGFEVVKKYEIKKEKIYLKAE